MNIAETKIMVRCPKCDWRIFDKITPTTGVIELKCPNCRKVVEVDLSLRKKSDIRYRIATYANKLNKIVTTK